MHLKRYRKIINENKTSQDFARLSNAATKLRFQVPGNPLHRYFI